MPRRRMPKFSKLPKSTFFFPLSYSNYFTCSFNGCFKEEPVSLIV